MNFPPLSRSRRHVLHANICVTVAIRFLRQLVVVPDEFYVRHLILTDAIGALFDLLEALLPRDNLLTSACLEFFDVIRKDDMKTTSRTIVKAYGPRIEKLLFIETFQHYGVRFLNKEGKETPNNGHRTDSESPQVARYANPAAITRHELMGDQLPTSLAEDEYWATGDDDDDVQPRNENGDTPSSKPLVDYASDEDLDDDADAGALSADEDKAEDDSTIEERTKAGGGATAQPPLERLSEKRRREEDQEEDLSQLIQHKRRNSSSASSNASSTHSLTRKKKPGAASVRDGGGGGGQAGAGKKISISLGAKTGGSDSQEEATEVSDEKS